jgi:hypothetical protein
MTRLHEAYDVIVRLENVLSRNGMRLKHSPSNDTWQLWPTAKSKYCYTWSTLDEMLLGDYYTIFGNLVVVHKIPEFGMLISNSIDELRIKMDLMNI